jgi:hypothetical protein
MEVRDRPDPAKFPLDSRLAEPEQETATKAFTYHAEFYFLRLVLLKGRLLIFG